MWHWNFVSRFLELRETHGFQGVYTVIQMTITQHTALDVPAPAKFERC